jgi:hypothetical protein
MRPRMNVKLVLASALLCAAAACAGDSNTLLPRQSTSDPRLNQTIGAGGRQDTVPGNPSAVPGQTIGAGG